MTPGLGFAWFRYQTLKPRWVINIANYGAFLFEGTEDEADEMRRHKAVWEGAIGHKRPASYTDLKGHVSTCWNHRGYTRLGWYGSRGRRLKRPYVPRFFCECGSCDMPEKAV